ncbi:hypothetical protein Dimus_015961 [Dionaea muscipula]
MSPAAGPASPFDRPPTMASTLVPPQAPGVISPPAEIAAKDAIIVWYRGEFAAANAIIDALCTHLSQLNSIQSPPSSEYEAVFTAIHRRRLNWIPVLQMQKYFSIADVAVELQKVAAVKMGRERVADSGVEEKQEVFQRKEIQNFEANLKDVDKDAAKCNFGEEDLPNCNTTDKFKAYISLCPELYSCYYCTFDSSAVLAL